MRNSIVQRDETHNLKNIFILHFRLEHVVACRYFFITIAGDQPLSECSLNIFVDFKRYSQCPDSHFSR